MKTKLSDLVIIAFIIIISIWILKFMFKLLYLLTPIIVIYIAYRYWKTRQITKNRDRDNQIFDAQYKDL